MNESSSMTKPVTNAATRSDEMTMDKTQCTFFGGVRSYFGEGTRILSHCRKSKCLRCFWNCQDDMWFSAHRATKGIKRFVLGAALGVQDSCHESFPSAQLGLVAALSIQNSQSDGHRS